MKRVVLACLLVCAAACSSTDTWRRGGATGLRLSGHSAYVMVPAPGGYDGIEFPKSSEFVAEAIVAAMRPHLQRILVGAGPESTEQAMHNARVAQVTYVVRSKILRWEDRPMFSPAAPDSVEIAIEVLDVASGDVLVSKNVTATSRHASTGGDHAEALLPLPMDECMRDLF